MNPPSIQSVVREILTADNELSADDVIRRAKARGLRVPDASIRTCVHNVRSELKKKRAKAAPAAARETAAPKAVAAPAASLAAAPAAPDLGPVFANVVLVNQVVGVVGGVENARQAAEAVRACGGVDAFLQHVDLVAGIRSPGA